MSTFHRVITAAVTLIFLVGASLVAPPHASASQGYKLGPNDVIRIHVFGEEDLTVETRVGGDGTINFPLLGTLHLQGKTIAEVQEYITAQLAKGYVRQPHVTARVVRHRNFYVSGEVKNPGGYPFEDGLSIQKVLSLAGGPTEKAEKQRVIVRRIVEGKTVELQGEPDTLIQPDDTILIPPSRRFYVMGEVKTPGAQAFEDGLTIQKALSLSGGPTEKADKDSVRVTRMSNGVMEMRTMGYDAAVRPDDILMVAEVNRKFYTSGEVKTPGAYPFKEGLTVHQALAISGGLTDKAGRGDLHLRRQTHDRDMTIPATLETSLMAEDVLVVPEGLRFYVSGEVKTPGRYPFENGLTVQKAMSLAGGMTERAENGSVKVTRVTNGVAEVLALKQDAAVYPDDILVAEPANHKFYASGEVKTPGGYPYKEGLTVHQALAMAGGLTEKAGRGDLQLRRVTHGHGATIAATLETPLMAEDVLVVPEGLRFYVSGEVKTPGRYPFENGLTVQKAMSLAGGMTERAENGSVKVTRVTNGVAEVLALKQDAAVYPDDILVAEPANHKFYASGEVKTPGGYPYKEGLTVHQALAMAGGLTEKAGRKDIYVLRHGNGREESIPTPLDAVLLAEDIVVVPEGQRFYVGGHVKTPGRYLHETDLTVQKALTLAGGLTDKAERGPFKLTRVIDGIPHTMDVDIETTIQANDFLVIPELKKVYVNGEVRRAGDYAYEKGLTVHKLITMAGGFTERASTGGAKLLRTVEGKKYSIAVDLDAVVQADDILVIPRSFF